jgi:spore germination protein GerM
VTGRPAARSARIAIVVTLLLGGCGVSTQTEPEPLVTATGDHPASRPAGISPGPTGSAARTQDTEIYFTRDNHLVAVRRRIPLGAGPTERLAALVAGPTPAESAAGITTALPPVAAVEGRIVDGVLVARLSPEFAELAGPQQILALAQLVYTATAEAGVTGLRLLDKGKPVQVPVGSGQLVSGPVGRPDYRVVAPP